MPEWFSNAITLTPTATNINDGHDFSTSLLCPSNFPYVILLSLIEGRSCPYLSLAIHYRLHIICFWHVNAAIPLLLLVLLFVCLWTVDDDSPQLLISQYTCASIHEGANTQTYTHRHAHNSTSIFEKIYSVAHQQASRLCWSLLACLKWRNVFTLIRTAPHKLDCANAFPILEQSKGTIFSP